MATVIPFLPSNMRAPRFNATLDGSDYEIVITWNVSAKRYYINVYDLQGNWIITVPLIQTPPARKVESAVYDPFLNIITVTLVDPSLWPLPLPSAGLNTKAGTVIEYTLEGFQPTTYNGLFRGMHINEITFTFPFPFSPGPVLILGNVSRKLNMVASVFNASTLIYRNGAFEVEP